jgi:hypothetical protein
VELLCKPWKALWPLDSWWLRGERRDSSCATSPGQDGSLLIDGYPFRVNALRFQIFEIVLIQVKAPFERTIGYSLLSLEQVKYLR